MLFVVAVYPELKKHLGRKAEYVVSNESKLIQRLVDELKELEQLDFNSSQFKARFFLLRSDLKPHELLVELVSMRSKFR